MDKHSFQSELTQLINKHSIENTCDMPDFLLAEMLCNFLVYAGEPIKKAIALNTRTPKVDEDAIREPLQEALMHKNLHIYELKILQVLRLLNGIKKTAP